MTTRKSSRREILLGTVFGSVLSVVLSAILLATVSLSAQVSFLIALVGVILSAFLGACLSFANRLDNLGGILLEGTRLRAVAGMPEVEERMAQLVTNLEVIEARLGGRKGFFWEASLLALDEAKESFDCMAGGAVNCTSDQEIQYIERALRYTDRHVMAVAARGPDWWAKPDANVYWTAYGAAARRLSIRRVFLVDDARDDLVRTVLNRHAALGMETFWTPINDVPTRLRRPIVLFDGRLLHRSTTNTSPGMDYVSFTDSARELEVAQAQFTAIMALPSTRKWPEEG